MSVFNEVLKISLIGTFALIPYVTLIEGTTMPEQTKNSTSYDETAFLGSERRKDRRDDRQDRRDDRWGYDGQSPDTAFLGSERRQDRRDDRQDRRDDRRGYDGQLSAMPSTQTPG